MAKIALIQSEMREFFSYMLMSAKLKEAGHEVDVFVIQNEAQLQWDYFCGKLDCDIIGFSSTTISLEKDLELAKSIKTLNPKPFIIFGGPQPTYNPEETIKHDCIDAICIGEGIDAIVELAEMITYDACQYLDRIDNIWIKNAGEIIKNPIRPISNVNDWPRPDYGLYYDKYPKLRNKPTKPVYIVRGCPNNHCAFCYNPAYNKMYRGKGKIYQCMSVSKAIAEIKWLKETYGFKWLQFLSDNMTINKKWLKEFMNEYKNNCLIGVVQKSKYSDSWIAFEEPYAFFMNCRANEVTKDIVDILKESGCNRVDFGVEHGNDFIRNKILNRNMSKTQIIQCGRWFKDAGIRVQTTNIFGLPHEDFNKAWESVELNREFVPEISKACILQPFENTEIYNYAKKNGLLKEDMQYSGTTYQIGVKDNRSDESKIIIDDEKQIIRLSYLFDWFVKNRNVPKWAGYIICSLPLDKLYKRYYASIFKSQENKYK